MLASVLEVAAALVGTFFMFVASLGILRLPDFYARIHAPTKAATLGLAFLLAAVALHFKDLTSVTKAALALFFVGVTAPVGAHILARAAYRSGVRAPGTLIDEYGPSAQRPRGGPGRAEDQ
ncbi:monovalent cation/proton antiporter subunit MnhG/PhaG [Sorangium cellulosum]|uniref:Monovalent cation/proton antiporter subunit MnhG/PhaG n=1 Tax=Sorangium cellulosum TaxID=56 RepID=A0A2L0ERV6_SORCE|nr:monovalent cation/proton antiporter subunit MnhG/PhaG [Sorangium cellulosum]